MVARDEQVGRLAVRHIAVDLDAVVEQAMLGEPLAPFVHRHGPIVTACRIADIGAGGHVGIDMEGAEVEFPVEPIHAAAEAQQAVMDVLPVKQDFKLAHVHQTDARSS